MTSVKPITRMWRERPLSTMEKTTSKTGTREDRAPDDAELDAVTGGVVVEKIGLD
jgi:hypothetical protein